MLTGAILKVAYPKTGTVTQKYLFDDNLHWKIECEDDDKDSNTHEVQDVAEEKS